MSSFLDRERTVAGPGYSRWMFPPAAIAVQMCIGEVYGFSVFNVPLTRLIGIKESVKGQDWTIPQVGWIYSIALIMLGLSAAIFGKWVERSGPRKTMLASALCFCGGLWIGAIGVAYHQLWLIYLGYGVIGGIGMGLGYIAPVSTLMNLQPGRPYHHFGCLVQKMESMFETGKAPYPVERTMLTSGILDFALESRFQGYKKLNTPDLANVRYQTPNASHFCKEGWGPDGKRLGMV